MTLCGFQCDRSQSKGLLLEEIHTQAIVNCVTLHCFMLCHARFSELLGGGGGGGGGGEGVGLGPCTYCTYMSTYLPTYVHTMIMLLQVPYGSALVTVSHRTFSGQFRNLSGQFFLLSDQINTSSHVHRECF